MRRHRAADGAAPFVRHIYDDLNRLSQLFPIQMRQGHFCAPEPVPIAPLPLTPAQVKEASSRTALSERPQEIGPSVAGFSLDPEGDSERDAGRIRGDILNDLPTLLDTQTHGCSFLKPSSGQVAAVNPHRDFPWIVHVLPHFQ